MIMSQHIVRNDLLQFRNDRESLLGHVSYFNVVDLEEREREIRLTWSISNGR